MKVSVIMGVYNTPEDYLNKCFMSLFESIKNYNYEIIIFNDGSNTETTSVLKKLSEENKNIILLGDGSNHGLAYGLNRCIDFATGDYIIRMDSDDYCSPDRINNELTYLVKNNLELVGCDMHLFDENGTWGEKKYNSEIRANSFLKTNPISHPTTIFSKKIFDNGIRYNESKWCDRNEDYELFMRIFSEGYKIGVLNEKLYYFREDKNAANRRTFKSRINESKVKYKGFKMLKLPFYNFVYCLRPIFIGLIPKWVYIKLRKRQHKLQGKVNE